LVKGWLNETPTNIRAKGLKRHFSSKEDIANFKGLEKGNTLQKGKTCIEELGSGIETRDGRLQTMSQQKTGSGALKRVSSLLFKKKN